MEYTLPIACRMLRLPADENAEFEPVTVDINTQEDTVATLKEKLQIHGFVIYFGEILKDTDRFRTFYDGKEKLVLIDCGPNWEESDDIFPSAASRLVAAGMEIVQILRALGRAIWHDGMKEFTDSANLIRRLVEAAGTEDYQDRLMSITSHERTGNLKLVGHFNEYKASSVSFPAEPGMDGEHQMIVDTGNRVRKEKMKFTDLSQEQQIKLIETRNRAINKSAVLEKAALAVVRMFGYHPLAPASKQPGDEANSPTKENGATSPGSSSNRMRVVPFTGFFVSPTLIMATKSCNYSKQYDTYATRYAFTRRARASYYSLTEGEDLCPCAVNREMTKFLVDRIRNIGIEIPEDIIPPENMAVRWSDILLFEVDDKYRSEVFLIPDINPITKGDEMASIAYHGRPSEKWMSDMFKDATADPFTERDLNDHFAGYNLKCCSVGMAEADEKDGVAIHSCCMLPTSMGSPIIRNFDQNPENNYFTFAGINCGRSRIDILTRTDSDLPKRFNWAISVRNLAFVLVYQHFVAPKMLSTDCFKLVRTFLLPYKILAEKERLRACHAKMLKDADDFNEYGMAFYEAQQLMLALFCFREGARMFSIANIPDQSEYDARLKDALQSNVSSVIMSLKEIGQLPALQD